MEDDIDEQIRTINDLGLRIAQSPLLELRKEVKLLCSWVEVDAFIGQPKARISRVERPSIRRAYDCLERVHRNLERQIDFMRRLAGHVADALEAYDGDRF